MEEFFREPVELTEFELDAVAGGNPFSINQSNVVGTNVAANSDFANGAVAGDALVIVQFLNVGVHA
jgi:hypothetical protein